MKPDTPVGEVREQDLLLAHSESGRCRVVCFSPRHDLTLARMSVAGLFAISLVINVGMWLERFVIIVTSLHRDFLPSSWGMYHGTAWDWSMYIGSIGLFFFLLLLFLRFLPMISIFEVRAMLPEAQGEEH